MRASPEHMEKIRTRILEAAGRGFREEGYGGLGVNGLAKRAGMTSGAFYGHFASKGEAFKEVVKQGLDDYEGALQQFEQEYGEEWPEHFLNYYLGHEHVDNPACSCAVPGLSVDVMRADGETRKLYSKSLQRVAATMANGLHDRDSGNALALMALLAGAVMMARCVPDSKLSQQVLDAARLWADKIVSG